MADDPRNESPATRDPSTVRRTVRSSSGEEFEVKVVDLGAAYKKAADSAVACFSCYCGSGCLCGCVN